MLLNDYQKQASGTAIYPGRMSPMGMMYCALKMNGEAGELADHLYLAKRTEGFINGQTGLRPDRLHAIIKEIGDVMWYIAAMADELETDLKFVFGGEPLVLEDGFPIDDEALHLNAVVGQIAEQLGKALRDDGYGMPPSYKPGALREGDAGNGKSVTTMLTIDRRSKILSLMRDAMCCLLFISAELDIPLQLAMEINIKKLADRAARGKLSGSGDNR